MITNSDIWGDFYRNGSLITENNYIFCECCKFWDFDITSDSDVFLCTNKQSKYYNKLVKYKFCCEGYSCEN